MPEQESLGKAVNPWGDETGHLRPDGRRRARGGLGKHRPEPYLPGAAPAAPAVGDGRADASSRLERDNSKRECEVEEGEGVRPELDELEEGEAIRAELGDVDEVIESELGDVDEVIELKRHRCNSRFCPTCGREYGFKVRAALLARVSTGLFERPQLLTLTIDRSGTTTGKGFGSPAEAHDYVTAMGYVRSLMRQLGVGVWAWVLEFQQGSGEGWPHWHVLIDLATCPGGRVDYGRAWHLWRDKWRMGGLDFSRAQRNWKSSAAAINYVTKYLTKLPERGYPRWVLDKARAGEAVRFCGGCKAVTPLVSPPRGSKPSTDPGDGETPARVKRDLPERLAACSMKSEVVRVTRTKLGRVVKRERLGTLPATPREVAELIEAGELEEWEPTTGYWDGVKVEHVEAEGRSWSRVTFSGPLAGACLHDLGRVLTDSGRQYKRSVELLSRAELVRAACARPWVDLGALRPVRVVVHETEGPEPPF